MNALITVSVLALVVLYLGLFKARKALLPVTVIGLLVALGFAFCEWNTNAVYYGMMKMDNFAIAFSGVTILGTVLIFLLTQDYFDKISEHVAEYYTLILFALAGILVMLSFTNLVMLFVGIEIMSVALYILAGIKKSNSASNEASLKYFLMGAFSTGFLLFGVTLIYGSSHSFDLAHINSYLVNNYRDNGISPMFYTGVILMLVGLCFKVGAAPFHFWTPDVYEGAPTLITTFMSTVVKTAGFAAFLRLFATSLAPLHDFFMPVLLVIIVLTLFIGNITALYQRSFKRLLAYSSISHVGYMLFAILAITANSANAVLLYTSAYTLATIVAFGVLILIQRHTGSDSIQSFNGLAKRNPFLAFVLTVAMLSLAGIPLTGGFVGKYMMFLNALSDYQIWLVVIAVVNAVIGIYYYFKVIVAMYFKTDEMTEVVTPIYYKVVFTIAVIATIVLGVYPGIISNLL